jgi:hypothetical protein
MLIVFYETLQRISASSRDIPTREIIDETLQRIHIYVHYYFSSNQHLLDERYVLLYSLFSSPIETLQRTIVCFQEIPTLKVFYETLQ